MYSRLSVRPRASVLLLALACLCLSACSDDTKDAATNEPDMGQPDTAEPDTGDDAGDDVGDDAEADVPDVEPDVVEPDPPGPYTCETVEEAEAVLGETLTFDLDTTTTEELPRDLGLRCGNPSGEVRWARQEVVAVRIPGDGAVAVNLNTAVEGTDPLFNTVLQVRTECERVPEQLFPPTCFDDGPEEEYRASGGFGAMGGDLIYILVTGYSEPPAGQGTHDEGAVRLEVTVTPNAPPTILNASALLAQEDTIFNVSGMDPDGNAVGVSLNFLVGDEILDIYGDGEATEEGDVYVVPFTTAPTEMEFEASLTVIGSQVALAGYLRSVGATTVRVRVYDAGFGLSEPLDVPLVEAETVGLGEACDEDTICRAEMTCVDAVCAATEAAMALCDEAIAVELPEITNEAVSVSVMGSTGAGVGVFTPLPACAMAQGTVGAEAIYTVTIPDGVTADLFLDTNVPGTGDTDTLMYLRTDCADQGSELSCIDDVAMDLQSQISAADLEAGTYFVFIETYGGVGQPPLPEHELAVTVTPVLPMGAECDNDGTLNRCAGGACADGVCP